MAKLNQMVWSRYKYCNATQCYIVLSYRILFILVYRSNVSQFLRRYLWSSSYAHFNKTCKIINVYVGSSNSISVHVLRKIITLIMLMFCQVVYVQCLFTFKKTRSVKRKRMLTVDKKRGETSCDFAASQVCNSVGENKQKHLRVNVPVLSCRQRSPCSKIKLVA
jgi:hypothetical protein